MKIKQLIPVTPDYAVLATHAYDFSGPCYDQQGDGHRFFWALIEEKYDDRIELLDVGIGKEPKICERRFVVPRKPCPHCNQQMEPRYDNKHRPIFWQECPHCGFIYDMRGHEEEF